MANCEYIIVAETEEGDCICVSSYKSPDIGDFVKTTSGIKGKVVSCDMDFSGSIRRVVSHIATIHRAEEFWSRYWVREGAENAEEVFRVSQYRRNALLR